MTSTSISQAWGIGQTGFMRSSNWRRTPTSLIRPVPSNSWRPVSPGWRRTSARARLSSRINGCATIWKKLMTWAGGEPS